ncbi:MAG: hydrogenase expression/formation protein HypC [Campylobacterota bacterium]|nr:hydrogenase expression/formation protein HypC [Campylobacterota bacterium]
MCLSIPSKVVKIDRQNGVATVDTMGVTREASLALVGDEEINTGDYVLLHIGFVMNKIDEKEALLSLEAFAKIAELMDEEEPL